MEFGFIAVAGFGFHGTEVYVDFFRRHVNCLRGTESGAVAVTGKSSELKMCHK